MLSSRYFPVIIPVSLSAKKGDTQPFWLGIRHDIPCVSIASEYGQPWQGLESLEPNKYRNSGGVRLDPVYSGNLLWRGDNLEGNRLDNAGYSTWEGSGADRKQVVMPSPVYRGEAIGECGFTVNLAPHYNNFIRWSDCKATDGARKWLHAELDLTILATIQEHKDTLRQAALANLRFRFAEGVASLRKAAQEREEEAQRIMEAISLPS
jgi:hypothetical protein